MMYFQEFASLLTRVPVFLSSLCILPAIKAAYGPSQQNRNLHGQQGNAGANARTDRKNVRCASWRGAIRHCGLQGCAGV